MRRGFSSGNNGIVTTITGPIDLAMIHRAWSHRHPFRRGLLVTGLTVGAAVDVAGGLTTGVGAVVTTDTVGDKTGMVRDCTARHGEPRGDDVAYLTGLSGQNMVNTLAPGQASIMTTRAGTIGLAVIGSAGKQRCPECRCRLMATFAVRAA